ncbi:MAG: hypothetical protein ABW252_06900 [Polyangiales bacterium]
MQKVITLSLLFVPIALAIYASNRPDPDEAVRWLVKRVALFFVVWAIVGVRAFFMVG